jgi:predicted transcriptional regulator
MPQTKETVIALLDRLPDDCSLDDVLYHLYVIQAVEMGLDDVAQGRVIPHDEVADTLRRKWQTGHAE